MDSIILRTNGTGSFTITTKTFDYDSTHDSTYDDGTFGSNPSVGWTYRDYHKYFGALQIKHLEHVTVGDFIDTPKKKINICPECYISVYKYL